MSSSDPIRVLVIHDDALTRIGLIAALGSYRDIQPVTCELDADALRSDALFVDVLVADYSNGIELAERFTRQCAARVRPKILIVTASDTEWDIRNAMERCIAGYLLAGCPLDDLAAGVRTVHRAARYFSPGVTQRLAESLSAEPLTCREEAVLQLVVDGLCNKVIASRLGVAVGTVKTHLRTIFDKLEVETRTQAVIVVARRGLLAGRNHHPTQREDASNARGMSAQYAAGNGGASAHHAACRETRSAQPETASMSGGPLPVAALATAPAAMARNRRARSADTATQGDRL
jgi:DNA-binding NarL/FixJ family response regulator